MRERRPRGSQAIAALGAPARALAPVAAVVLALTAVAWLRRIPGDGVIAPAAGTPAGRPTGPPRHRVTVACALLAMVAAVVCNRPDIDDSRYLALANAVADLPAAPLLGDDPLRDRLDGEQRHPHHRLRGLEPLLGVGGRLTGVPPVVLAHLWMPPLVAVALVLAHRRLLRRLAPRRWAWALAATTAILLTVGDGHGWHCNFGVVRLHQGKGVLVSVLLPLAIAAALDFARRPGPRRRGSTRSGSGGPPRRRASASPRSPAPTDTASGSGARPAASPPRRLSR